MAHDGTFRNDGWGYCRGCVFWRSWTQDAMEWERKSDYVHNECHFNAPIPIDPDGSGRRRIFAKTNATEFCGQWMPHSSLTQINHSQGGEAASGDAASETGVDRQN